MNSFSFIKMHGLGNDFAMIDARNAPFVPSLTRVQELANRRTGIGFDQLIIIEKPSSLEHNVRMIIYNADGSRVGACGNASRCVAKWYADTSGQQQCRIETDTNSLDCEVSPAGISVDMGLVKLDWRDIPLSKALDTASLEVGINGLLVGTAVNVGNPHIVFFVDDISCTPVAEWGNIIEHHPLFPERVNVEFVQVLSPTHVRMRVWERGVGITQACGTGACAVAVAGFRRNLCERKITVTLDGGDLTIDYLKDGHVLMTGSASYSYQGKWLEGAL